MRTQIKTYTVKCDYCDNKAEVKGEGLPKGWSFVKGFYWKSDYYGGHYKVPNVEEACPKCSVGKEKA
jgi:hypothetical protein